MGRYARRKGKAASCKGIGRRGGKTKTRTRDIDQIKNDITEDILNNEEFIDKLVTGDTDKTSQWYCVECSRFFQNGGILLKHTKSKAHKQRVKKLKDWPDDM